MCGICGVVSYRDLNQSKNNVLKVREAMRSRGPEAEGLYADDRVVFGHRRLKIIDLSDAANQPFVDKDLGLVILFNGIIYNYPELRTELIKEGYRFQTHSDTEVIAKSYHFWGEGFLSRLNGMFAFCVLEIKSGKVTLYRDRMGIKPLYYSMRGDELLFASSLPALIKGFEIPVSLDPIAIYQYFMFHSVVPAPATLFNEVKKLEPATCMTLVPGEPPKIESYWDYAFETPERRRQWSASDWEKELEGTLLRSIQRRMVSDVPVGVLLSGGLDSSLIVSMLRDQGQKDIRTFSIGFESAQGTKGDEFEYSDMVVKQCQTKHHKIEIPSGPALKELPNCIRSMNEPMVSHDNIGFYLLSKEVSKHIKVVLSGQGADEIFAGYHWYPPMVDSKDAVDTYCRSFCDREESEMKELLTHEYQIPNAARKMIEGHFAKKGASSAIDKALRIDQEIMLVDDPVKRVDSQTMAWSLEARVPFLDHELVELAAQIPFGLKIEEQGKGILKKIARNYLPDEVIDRPKGYFPVPALKFLKGPYLDLAKSWLEHESSQKRGILRQEYLNDLLKDPANHITPLGGSKLWQAALLEGWLQIHEFDILDKPRV